MGNKDNRLLTVTDLSVSLMSRVVLSQLNLTFAPNQLHFVIGPNGSGKTTFLKSIAQLLPYQGTIALGTESLGNLHARQIARHLAWVPQKVSPRLPLRVFDYVLMGRFPYLNWLGQYSTEDHLATEQALSRLQLSSFQGRLVNELSGGEQQKVAIARALAQNTDWILLDEPVQSLDPFARDQIFELMFDLAQSGKTLICSTHHLEPCQLTRTIGIRDGVVVMDEKNPQFDRDRLESLYGAHFSEKNT